ncbi:MAG: hypothetical protein J0649_00125 [Methylococcales bacterium]|nr:hypothetical protein [Methylococcales bacterium]
MNHSVKFTLLSLFMMTVLHSNISNAASDRDTKLKNNSDKSSIIKKEDKEKEAEHKNPIKKDEHRHEHRHEHSVSPS